MARTAKNDIALQLASALFGVEASSDAPRKLFEMNLPALNRAAAAIARRQQNAHDTSAGELAHAAVEAYFGSLEEQGVPIAAVDDIADWVESCRDLAVTGEWWANAIRENFKP